MSHANRRYGTNKRTQILRDASLGPSQAFTPELGEISHALQKKKLSLRKLVAPTTFTEKPPILFQHTSATLGLVDVKPCE